MVSQEDLDEIIKSLDKVHKNQAESRDEYIKEFTEILNALKDLPKKERERLIMAAINFYDLSYLRYP